jgi:uncharacterized surface protein with fasciclin (FAS1) repeats
MVINNQHMNNSTGIKRIMTGLLIVTGLLACRKDNVPTVVKTAGSPPTQLLSAAVAGNPGTTIFAAALRRTHLDDTLLSGKAPYTVFVPTDAAFTAAGISLQAIGGMSPDSLRALVRYHIAPGYYPSYTLTQYVTTRLKNVDSGILFVGRSLHYTTDQLLTADFPDYYCVNGISADSTDKDCINGVLFTLSGILTPVHQTTVLNYMAGDPRFSLFTYALHVTGMDISLLDSTLLGTQWYPTVFAPTDSAMINSGSLRSTAAIDSFYADDQANNRMLLTRLISFHVISFGIPPPYPAANPPTTPYMPNDMLNATYRSLTGYGTLPSSYASPGWGYGVNILVKTDSRQNISLFFGLFSNTGGGSSLGSHYAHPGPPVQTSNAIVYPLDAVVLPY